MMALYIKTFIPEDIIDTDGLGLKMSADRRHREPTCSNCLMFKGVSLHQATTGPTCHQAS